MYGEKTEEAEQLVRCDLPAHKLAFTYSLSLHTCIARKLSYGYFNK